MHTKRKQSVIITAVLLVVLVVSGTFAWTSFSQGALNENNGSNTETAGGRIHDDYNKGNGNKDIYGENYGTDDLLVRIKLSEYFEINNEALVSGTAKEDKNSWTPYVLESTGPSSDYREYITWTLGGNKIFLPTFNTNSSNHSTDASGDAIDSITGSQTAEGDGTHDYFSEGMQVVNPEDETQLHTVKQTVIQTQEPMSMDEWISAGRPVGNFWVIDIDGWAYWADLLKPGEATSLLLDQLTYKETSMNAIDGDWYYGIDVIGEFTNVSDKDKFPNSDHGAPSDNGNDLIGIVTDEKRTTYALEITDPKDGIEVKAGSTFQAVAKVIETDMNNQTSDVTSDSEITWSVSPENAASADSSGKVTIKNVKSDTMVTVTATSNKYNVSDTIQLMAKAKVYTYALNFTSDIDSITMNSESSKQFGAVVVQADEEGIEKEMTDTNIFWTISPSSAGSIDSTGKVTLNTIPEDTQVTVTATDVTYNVSNNFTFTAKAAWDIAIGDTFDFHGEDYIYLKDLGDGDRLIIRKYILPTDAATSTNYNNSALDRAMKTYYDTLSTSAKTEIQPVQSSFSVGNPVNENTIGRDSDWFLVANPTRDRAIVTKNGEKKAFALSLDELNDVSGINKAFPTLESRGGAQEADPATTVFWWLRSPSSSTTTWVVHYGANVGKVASGGNSTLARGVRPALIIHRVGRVPDN